MSATLQVAGTIQIPPDLHPDAVDAIFIDAVDRVGRDEVAPRFWSRLESFRALLAHHKTVSGNAPTASDGRHSARRRRRAAHHSAEMMRFWACENVPLLVSDARDAFAAFDGSVAAAVGAGVAPTARVKLLRAELRDRFNAELLGRAGGHETVLRAMASYFERTLLCFERRESGDAAEGAGDAESLSCFERVCGWLRELGWSELLAGTVTEVAFDRIEAFVASSCGGLFEEPMLESALAWLRRGPACWHAFVLGREHAAAAAAADDSSSVSRTASQWGARLEYRLHECFFSLRCSELFDIIRDFPESRPALIDVAACLRRTQGGTQQHPLLVQSLSSQLRKRLLHPGAETAQVVDVYISTIRALAVVDATGVLLQAVADPVKAYLRRRTDTVRSIVASLTDDTGDDGGPSELFEELGKDRGAVMLSSGFDDGASPTTLWTPDAIEADPTRGAHTRRSDDIIQLLVAIYGSTELFVNEYQILLARKLVDKFGFDTEREMHTLELLKRRFGDGLLRPCEVMLKDLEDSRRINTNVATVRGRRRGVTDALDDSVADALEGVILSRHFWPKASTAHPIDTEIVALSGEERGPKQQSIKLHPTVENALNAFGEEYARQKQPRSLIWQKCLGSVMLELAIAGGEMREFTVSPLHASLILHFADQEVWSLANLVAQSGMPESMSVQIQRHMQRWVALGVVVVSKSSEGGEVYTVASSLAVASEESEAAAGEEESVGGESAEAQQQRKILEAMKVYESFIVGMLRNMPNLATGRIHNMLKMFCCTDPKYTESEDQLGAFLENLVDSGTLETDGDSFKLAS